MSQILPQDRNWAVVIVHGVGTPREGQTMQAVCQAIREARPDFQPADVRADIPSESDQVAHERPAVQHWTFGDGGRAKVAEAFWGDLSLVRGTIPEMVRALGYNLHGAVYLSKSALQGAGLLTRLLPLIPFYLVRWVVLPLHILALGVALPFCLWLLFWDDPRAGDYLTSHNGLFLLLTLSYAVAGIVAGIYLIRRWRHKLRPPPWDLAFAFAAWSALSASFSMPSLISWFRDCEHQAAKLLEYGTASVIKDLALGRFELTKLCAWIVTRTPMGSTSDPNFGDEARRLTGIGRYIGINELAGDTAFYLCAAVVLLYILLTAANALLGRRETARAMLLVATLCSLVVVMVAILLEVADFLTRLVQFWADGPGYVAYLYEILLAVWLAIVAAGAAVAIFLRRRELLPEGSNGGARFVYSRVIVSRVFQITVLVATLVLIPLVMADTYLQANYPKLVAFRASMLLVAPGFLAFLIVVIIFSRPLRLGLDIATDIINHFVRSGGELPVRRAISQRFYEALDRLTADGERPHLLVIAHSQGSVITVDAMLKDIWSKPFIEGRPPLSERVSTLTILTFGSPVTHIYQHYFPSDYSAFSGTSLKDLAENERVRWVNIYREDDPIGTHIEGPNEHFPKNAAMPAGGHTRYWKKEVFTSPLVRPHLPGVGPCGGPTPSDTF